MVRLFLISIAFLAACAAEPIERDYGGRAPVFPPADAGVAPVVDDDDAGVEFYTDAGFVESCGTSDRQWSEEANNFGAPFPEDWEPSCFYPVEDTFFGRYTNAQGDPFEITLDTDERQDNYRLSPYEVGELAYWMTVIHAWNDLPCKNERSAYDWLSKGHFVVTGGDDVFDRLFEGDGSNYGAFITANKHAKCYRSPDDVYWTSVVRRDRWNRTDVRTVVHEMTHMLSIAVNGHSDGEHEDPRLWENAGGEDSLQAIVIDIHDCTYFPTYCVSLPDGGVRNDWPER